MDEATRRKTYFLLAATTIIWGIQPLCIKWLGGGVVACDDHGHALLPDRHDAPGTVRLSRRASAAAARLCPRAHPHGGYRHRPQQCHAVHGAGHLDGDELHADCGGQSSYHGIHGGHLRARAAELAGWGGIVLSFLGALLVISHGSLAVIETMSFNEGDILFLLAQVAWTTYSLIALKIMRRMSALQTTGWAGISAPSS